MNTPILTKYKFDVTGKDPENLIGGERHTIASGPKNKIIAALEGPFFSDTVKVRLEDGSYLDPWVDFQPVHHFPEASKRTGRSCTCFVKILNESVVGDIFVEYQVVGGSYSYNSITLENLLWAIINDERDVLWDNINNKPATYPPSYHIHDIFLDTYGWEDRIAFATWVADGVIMRGERLNYEGFMQKVDVVMDQIKQMQTMVNGEVLSHSAEQGNPHGDTANALGYTKLQNLATADDIQALEGTRPDLRLTVKGAQDILSNALNGYSINLIHQGNLPVTRFGNLNFLQPGIIGSFEGASMIEAEDRYAQNIENDGTFIRLRPGTNGETMALYYDYVTNIHRNINTFTMTNTNNKYLPSGLDQAYIPARLFDCQGDVIAGIMYNKSVLPDTSDYKYWIALTNGSLDSTKHNCAEITNAYYVNDEGNAIEFTTMWTQFCMIGDRIYVISQRGDAATIMEAGGRISLNRNPALYLGYINVSDIIAGGKVTFNQITGWTTTFMGQTRAPARSIQLCDQIVGRSGQHVLTRYDGGQRVIGQYRVWPASSGKMAYNPDGTLTLLADFTLNVDSLNNSTISLYAFRLIVDVNARTVRTPDPMTSFQVVDDTPSTIKMTNRDNGSKLNMQNLRGLSQNYGSLDGDYHGSRYISKKGYSILSHRQQATNVGLSVHIQQLPNFVDENTYWRNPASNQPVTIRVVDDSTSYGSEAKGNLRCPILFPNNRIGFYTMDNTGTHFASQPLNGNGDFTYRLMGMGNVQGFQPSNDRVRAVIPRAPREIITEINGDSVVTHCRTISDNSPSGPAEIDYMLNTSGSISTDLGYMRNQAQQVLNTIGVTAVKFTCMLFVPVDRGMSIMLKIVGFTPAQANGVTDLITVITSVDYNGDRNGNLVGWVANTGDIVSLPQSVGTYDISYIQQTFGMMSYKVGNDYIIALGGFQCAATVGPGASLILTYVKMTNGRIAGNPSSVHLVAPYDDLLSNTPFALPGRGIYVTYNDSDYTALPPGPNMQAAVGPCAIVLASQGTDYDVIRTLRRSGLTPMILLSQTVEQGWILYFAEPIPIILGGREYTIPITSIDLRSVQANPANTTFYTYVEVVDANTAKYTISPTELTTTPFRMFVGTVKTNSSQIFAIDITKRSGINKYQVSATKTGSSIPVSTGLPQQLGDWSQA